MTVDAYSERLARVRLRFVSTLPDKIDNAFASIPNLSAIAPAAASTVSEISRSMHGIVGIGPTVGFPATGGAARDVEDILSPAQRDRRGLTDDEALLLKERLHALRRVAARELQVSRSDVQTAQ